MTRPKTYGEYANQTSDVHVDSRVRDREITDDAWVMLHMEDELEPEIVQKLKVTRGRRTYVDYYDENNVVLTTSTTHPASLMLSGIVGDRCDVRYRYSDGLTGKYHTAKSMGVLFGNLNRSAMTDIRVNDLGNDTGRFYDTPIDTNIMHERIRRQIQRCAETLPDVQLNKDIQGGPHMTKGFEWAAANGDTLKRAFRVTVANDSILLSRTDAVTYVDTTKSIPFEVEYTTKYEGGLVDSSADNLQDKLPDVIQRLNRWMMTPPSRTATLPKALEAVRDFRLTDASERLTNLANIASERLVVSTEMTDTKRFAKAQVNAYPVFDEEWADTWAEEHKQNGKKESRANMHLGVNLHALGGTWEVGLHTNVSDGFHRHTRTSKAVFPATIATFKEEFGAFVDNEVAKTIVSGLDGTNEMQQL